MNYEDDAVRRYYSLKPAQFGFLESFELRREIQKGKCSDYALKLEMRSLQEDKDQYYLTLSFTGVRDLRIGDLEGLTSLLIDIRSLQGYQLEDLCYRIAENENDAFSFCCKDFKAVVRL